MLANDAEGSNPPIPFEVEGCLDIAHQAKELLVQLTDEQYNYVAKPYLQSSIGQHMRHILDVFQSLMAWPASSFIDYDKRRRQHPVEKDKSIALEEWGMIEQWVLGVSKEALTSPLTVSGEVSLHQQVSPHASTTLGRELSFVASHAIHHFALLRVSLCAQNIPTDHVFGLAPTTASYYRRGS
ncbi:DinB family protein [Enterovibrio sp. ZSDZ35]|uniref:DinB family protein n=1 Tax=Enterovibrio qingdaonensis TaxID=2899818 RepID=A0ABT5QUU5_9GAMM|nr:DinB family protein [Enterovibrio sp. ZSDZ35]MDD1784290.1 DinB family protein [Enterovibrio sp. ZSDZ35]